jgi:hypothetical protein
MATINKKAPAVKKPAAKKSALKKRPTPAVQKEKPAMTAPTMVDMVEPAPVVALAVPEPAAPPAVAEPESAAPSAAAEPPAAPAPRRAYVTLKKKVFWKPAETRAVALWLLAQGIDIRSPNILRFLRQAQTAVLPPERHRSITSDANADVVRDDWQAAVKDFAEQQAAAAEAKRQQEEAAARRKAEAAEAKRQQEEAAAQRQAEIDAAVAAARAADAPPSLDQLVREMASAFARQFAAQVRASLHEELAHHFESSAAAPTEPRASHVKLAAKPRILIVGLKPQQAGMIAQEFQHLDLRFVESGTSPQAIANKATHCDVVIGVIDFLSHAHEDHMKGHANYIRLSGGMDKLRNKLTALGGAIMAPPSPMLRAVAV